LLAGRKLLLADDSITIQKVVDLTFVDEGVTVVCVNNGREAIERLEEFSPDIVLADVFMPQINGYEVCEYIKQNEKLRHIPVMLLVGSFEPFDEAEARRVGADETLTKPFQSIRRLIEKVGTLVSGRPTEKQIPTAGLPRAEMTSEREGEKLTTQEIELTTADTKELPPEIRDVVDEAAAAQSSKEERQATTDTKADEGKMETKVEEAQAQVSQGYEGAGDVLLDLGDYEPVSAAADDFVLDIDLDDVQEPAPVEVSSPVPSFVDEDRYGSSVTDWQLADKRSGESGSAMSDTNWSDAEASETTIATTGQLATTQEFQRPGLDVPQEPAPEPVDYDAAIVEEQAQPQEPVAQGSEQHQMADLTANAPQQLSPEMIDAIARRAVEHLSEKVVQEIAWEVVPQLAELLIKRQLEEKNS